MIGPLYKCTLIKRTYKLPIRCLMSRHYTIIPVPMQYLAQVSQPRGRHFYQKYHISNPGGTILTKNVLFPTQGAGF